MPADTRLGDEVTGNGGAAVLAQIVRLLRPKEWVKNAFVIAPLFFTPNAVSRNNCLLVLFGAMLFCAASSAVYVLNDLMDCEADRLHPKKRYRPVASGAVKPWQAAIIGTVFGIVALSGGFFLSVKFGTYLAAYLVINAGYSFGLKTISILDILLIAVGFVIRVFAGATLIGGTPSPWIIIATGLISLFLAAGKRRDDLVQQLDSNHRSSLTGYSIEFLDTLIAIILGTLIVSYLMYTTSEEVMQRLSSRHLYVTSAFVVAGIFRYLQLAMVARTSGSPTDVVLRDRFIFLTMIGWLFTFGYFVYG
ncbi:MAG TPA: UbiA prenyltransferase family protein [Bradyrhizobium sp.]|nr:UbiA prenyltransferase family protein [Bradyrhizobium sp.]